MESKVTVLTPHGRRQIIKVKPNTTILQILEEVCNKYGFECDSFRLKHHNREVDLGQMFRFSGLPNNCLLEMEESQKKRVSAETIQLCIQLEDGTRQQGEFVSSETLWNAVKRLHGSTANAYEHPVVLYMRQEICGRQKLEETTLKKLGIIEGRAMIRFINKKPEELKTQASVYVAPTVKEKNEVMTDGLKSRDAAKAGGGGFAITKELVQSLKPSNFTVATSEEKETPNSDNSDEKDKESPKKVYDWGTGSGKTLLGNTVQPDEQAATAPTEMETEPEMIIIGERNALLYSLDNIHRELEELPDSFYDLTVNDLKLVLRDLKRVASGNEDAPLLTAKLRELEQNKTMLNKIAHYKNCIIRIQLPDRHVLQGVFKPIDQFSSVVSFVRKFLLEENAKFYLFTIPPKVILPLDKNLLELDLVPTAVVHFAWETEVGHTGVLKPEYYTQLTTVEGAIYAANKLRLTHRARSTESPVDDDERPGPSTGAIPKRPRNDNPSSST